MSHVLLEMSTTSFAGKAKQFDETVFITSSNDAQLRTGVESDDVGFLRKFIPDTENIWMLQTRSTCPRSDGLLFLIVNDFRL